MKTNEIKSRLNLPNLRLSKCGKAIETDDGLKLSLSVARMNPCGSLTKEESNQFGLIMAAAPEMLVALEALLAEFESRVALVRELDPAESLAMHYAQDAIAKATTP